ncbi:tRNA pseudouridine synthase A [Actinomyces sp. zg-332]|uniref:tRNA pseudouridine synthase A n=1 Tax=Actinomyces sp. zg-332 TaxID=2708340 RepID=UPI001423887A|nr:tRNA pseudouridine synthase A [Actinomyces sp. zg-332]QPK94276.1 tRNA pseudouridine synthase A [Actinomyces sp. zg-332]
MSIRIRIDFSYDGSRFHGYAYQNDLRTVQGELQKALKIFTRDDITLTVAGRTDAGVHASHQVAHFDISLQSLFKFARVNAQEILDSTVLANQNVRKSILNVFSEEELAVESFQKVLEKFDSTSFSIEELFNRIDEEFLLPNLGKRFILDDKAKLQVLYALIHAVRQMKIRFNNVLAMLDKSQILHGTENKEKTDIVVHDLKIVSDDFDARFSALSRKYIYTIADSFSYRNVFRRNYVLWHENYLDVELMNKAAEKMLGEHDFLSYCKPREGATTIRTLKKLEVSRNFSGEIEVLVQADAFCHSMVRSIVGVLILIGQGSKKVCWGRFLLDNPSRNHSVNIAPPHGLSLVEVKYPSSDLFFEQAEKAKVKRVLNKNIDEKCCD